MITTIIVMLLLISILGNLYLLNINKGVTSEQLTEKLQPVLNKLNELLKKLN